MIYKSVATGAARSWWRVLRLLLLVVAVSMDVSSTTPGVTSEHELKAAFIYNLMTFIEWPPSTNPDHLVVGVAGDGPLTSTLSAYFAGKRSGMRKIQVNEVHSRAEMKKCNLLVIAYSDSARVREVLTQLQGSNVLSVGDGEAFAASGGVIAFVARDNRLQLAINPRAAERAKVHLSAKLLSMARIVQDADAAR